MAKVEEISTLINNKILSKKDDLIYEWQNPQKTNTKHLVIDDLLPNDLCMKIYNSFPKNLDSFYHRSSFREKKKTSSKMHIYHEIINNCLYAFQDQNVLDLISEITGISDLEADKKLYAGGISAMSKGDYLNPHIDNSHDMERIKYRRLNLLYYVSPQWEKKCGGNFELWDKNVKLSKTIVSNFNRLILMETTKKSWHSVNKVISNNTRFCVSNYYFSKKPPIEEKEKYFHVTSFTGRPEERFKRTYGKIDNVLRNTISRIFKYGRGKKLINSKNRL